MRKCMLPTIAALILGATAAAGAAEIEVKMLNKGSDGTMMVFEPALIKAEVGDTIKFVATDPSHNAETIKNMIPDGAKPFVGKFNADVVVNVEVPGVYGVKCMPHYAMGMVALIVVGAPANLDKAKSVTHAGKAKQNFSAMFDKIEASKTAELVR